MLARYADRVTLVQRADDGVLDVPVPSLLLQPLLENAFKHGVERSIGPVRIEVAARRDGDFLRLDLSNSGSSLAEGGGAGIGLRNVRDRLAVIYGGGATLELASNDQGVTAEIVLPLRGPASR